MREAARPFLSIMIVALSFVGPTPHAAGPYPRTIVAQARAASGTTTITAAVTITINRLVEPARRDRVIRGLTQNGYQGFMDALRPLPVIGSIATQHATVNVKYAWETHAQDRVRLVVVADSPLFFLPGDRSRARAGYQLTIVQLLLDEAGAGSGLMSGAARVKPSPDEGIVLEDYGTAPVELTVAAK